MQEEKRIFSNANHLQLEKHHMKLSRLLSVAVLSLSLTGCQNNANENTIYTSCYASYDFAKRIVGDLYKVENLVPAGSEPHDFEPTAKTVTGLSTCKALFLNGIGLEHWADDLPKSIDDKKQVISKGIEIRKVENVDDPHVWLSVKNAIKEMENIKDIMCELDKENSKVFEDNFEKEKTKFEALDVKYTQEISALNNRYLVVSHAAFGYLCDAYNLTQIYVSGLTPDDEPTSKDMENIIKQVQDYNITTIFYEELVSPEISKKIADETGVKTETLNPLESLEEEDLQTEDYISIMESNLEKIKAANK